MRVDSAYKYVGIIVLAAILAGGLLWFGVVEGRGAVGASEDSVAAVESVSAVSAMAEAENTSEQAAVVSTTSDGDKKTEAFKTAEREAKRKARLEEAERRISHLQSLLDDEESKDELLDYAKKLLRSGIAIERLAALQAMQWVDSRGAVDALIPMLADEEELADMVNETLRNIIEESLFTDVRVMDKEDWLETLKASGNEDGMNVYLTLLSAFPELDSVPVLIELYKSDSALNKKMAQEFMEFIAHGESIPSAQAAEKWWKKWLDERGITEQDLIDYENAGKEDNDALKGEDEGESGTTAQTEQKPEN